MSFCSFFGKEYYKYNFKPGIYVCSQCGHPLFSSRSKYERSSPWPAFTETIREDSVTKHMETLTAYKVRIRWFFVFISHEFLNDGPEEGLSRF
uniref:Methionine sulfoxide reductase B1b n=1 Tax=Sinocyclocheilus anshuiensis TaxID=1608454 RepID=A0A671RCT6_9TELE